MKSTIYSEFKYNFPLEADKTIGWREFGLFEIAIDLNDGTQVIYNSVSKSLRQYNQNLNKPNDLSEENWRFEFGRRLEYMMMYKGVTQSELATLSGISIVSLSKYINGRTSPSTYNITKLADALDCSTDDLINFTLR